MAYDWDDTITLEPGSSEWFAEVDRRFLAAAYYAHLGDGVPFGRFLRPADVAGKSVLEVGCGMGTHAAMLARAGAHLTAIDLTERAVMITRQRFARFGLCAQVQQADAEALPFGDASFDAVWSWGVIHHSRVPERCLAEMTRVLRPGGRLLVMVYHRHSLVYYVHAGLIRGVLLGGLLRRSLPEIYVAASDGAYARVFTRRELRALLEPDFEDVEFSVVGQKSDLWPIPGGRVKTWLEQRTPDALARVVLGCWGSMVVVDAIRRNTIAGDSACEHNNTRI